MSRSRLATAAPSSPSASVHALAPGSLSLFDDNDLADAPARRRPRVTLDGVASDTLDASPIGVPPPRRRERPWPEASDPSDVSHFEVIAEPCQSLLRANDAPDLPCAMAINPYRLTGLGPHQSVVHAKVNAAERLRAALARPGYVARPINLGSLVDAYHPVEQTLRLSRQVIELLHACRHPLALATRSVGLLRDLDWLADLARRQQVVVLIGLAGLDAAAERQSDPALPHWVGQPEQRLHAMRRLARAGVWVGLNLTVSQLSAGAANSLSGSAASSAADVNQTDAIDRLVAAAAQAGARSVHWRPSTLAAATTAASSGPAESISAAPWRAHVAPHLARWSADHGLSQTLPALDASRFEPPAPPAIDRIVLRPQRELFEVR